ncbi:MAG TPA: serine hydrolase domain-containing protein [Terracidiphilus sp.]|nr:serine hydrolase domain-containing protein [Terracidiphilus sp.]
MLNRRELVKGAIAGGIVSLGHTCIAAPEMEPIRIALRQTVGTREKVAGMIAVIIDQEGTWIETYGSSGVPGLPLNVDAVFEIVSNTKVFTALLLADMVHRGEVAFRDPVAKYLPVTLHEHAGPITLLDLATYTSGLPNMPGNLPADWWAAPDPMGDYTEAKLYEFLSSYVPKYEPGKHYEYANLGFGLLGIALARRAGKSYEELLIERVCNPLGLAHTRITLTPEMRGLLVQGHDVAMKQTNFWNGPAMPGAGFARSTARDLTAFVKANMGLAASPLREPMKRMLEVRRPTSLAGTAAGLGWFITSDGSEEIVWKSGLSAGCNTFIGFSPQGRRGVVLLSNFLWQPIDAGTIGVAIRMIKPDFHSVDFNELYPHS